MRGEKGVAGLYSAMLDSHRTRIDVAMQRRIWEYAKGAKRNDLVVSLLRQSDIDPELEAEIAAGDDLEILEAWASSPRRTSEQLRDRLTGEKRVGALLPLAAREKLPVEVYEAIAAIDSVKLAETLLDNRSVPKAIRDEKLRFLVTRPSWNSRRSVHKLSGWVSEGGRDAVEIVTEGATSVEHLAVAAKSPELDDTLATRMAHRLKEMYLSGGDDSYSYSVSYTLPDILQAISRRELDDSARAACLEVIAKAGERIPTWAHTRMQVGRLIEAFDPKADGFHAALRRLTDATDDIDGAVRTAFSLAENNDERRLAFDTMARKQGVSDEVITENLRHASHVSYETLANTLLDEDRIEALVRLLSENHWLSSTVVRRIRDHRRGREIVTLILDGSKHGRGITPGWCMDLLTEDRYSDLVVDGMPWSSLSELLARADMANSPDSAGIGQRVQEMLLERLGDDAQRWEIFTRLGADYGGTLKGLLDSVETLAG